MQEKFVSIAVVCVLVMMLFSLSAHSQEKEQGMWISGRVIWPGHDLSKKASVQVFKDRQLKELYTKGLLLDPEGTYTLIIEEEGAYYMVAFVDDNSNDKFDAGDGMGIYGVMDWADQRQESEPVRLEKGQKALGIDIEITAIVDNQGRVGPISVPSHGNITTGITGKLIWPEHKFTNAIVFVYADPSWNNRIAQTKASETGEYEVSIPAGRYYLLAVIDENDTNLLDASDKFGIWGMTRFGTFPKPVKVEDGKVRSNRNILIIGEIDANGKPIPFLDTAGDKGAIHELPLQEGNITLSGKVIWPGHDVKNAIVQAYSDPSMTVATAKAKTDNKGDFRLILPEGDYYIMAGVDSNADGKYTEGDGIGAYGTEDAANQMPKMLTVNRDSQNKEIALLITAEFDSSGQLKPIPDQTIAEKPPEQQKEGEASLSTGMSGKIVWEDHKIIDAILVFSKDPGFESGIRVSLKLNDDGSYACTAAPGSYYIMAVADHNGNDQIDSGDGIGFYGTGYWGAGHWGDPQKVAVLEGNTTPYIIVNITALLGDDGKPVQTRGSVRSYYGAPDNIYDNTEQDTQEWWYWSRGIAFTFKKTDADWSLIDTYEFTPKDTLPNETSKTEKGTIYYIFDRNIWAISADGTGRRWLTYGDNVTGTFGGDILLFTDNSKNLNSVNPKGTNPEQTVANILTWKEAILESAISNDGKLVAFTRDKDVQKLIYVRNLETGEEVLVPAGNMDLSCPAWSAGNELIAYSASSLFQNPQQPPNRDIYYYDLVAKRTDRVSTNPQDEFDPIWSPGDRRILVYCRADGEHSQLWIVNFDAQGNPVERQLTKYGGQNPAWSPAGDRIIYENNAQLWTINPDGKNESPIIVNGEPVFGLDPLWTR